MKAIINGIEVNGTPQEIWEYQQIVSKAQEVRQTPFKQAFEGQFKQYDPGKDKKTFIGDGQIPLTPYVTSGGRAY